jgi:integrase
MRFWAINNRRKMTLSKEVYKQWMGYPSVIRLYDWFLLKAGGEEYMSKKSLGVYLENIREFVLYSGSPSPDAVLTNLGSGEMLAKINEWVMVLTRKKNAPASIVLKVRCVKRFFKVNSVSIDWEKVTLPKKRYIVADKSPSKLELRKILVCAPLWVKVAVLIMVSSGIRVGGLLMLKVKDVDFEKYSDIAVLKIPPEASKARVGYYSFISPEARVALQGYLGRRGQKETVNSNSPLIRAPTGDQSTYMGFRQSYARTLERAGLDTKDHGWNILRIHTLRKYFRTSLEGTLTKSQIERLMGHVSGEYLDGSYFRPPEADMVEAYRRAIHSLTVLEDTMSREFQLKQLELQLQTMHSLGLLTDEQFTPMIERLHRSKSVEEFNESLKKLPDKVPETPIRNGSMIANSEEEMLKLLDEGWDMVSPLNGGGRFIMKKRT